MQAIKRKKSLRYNSCNKLSKKKEHFIKYNWYWAREITTKKNSRKYEFIETS